MNEKRREFINGLLVEVGDIEDIPVEDDTLEDYKKYLEYKEKRNERVFKKFGKETAEQKWKREQKELQKDLDMEFNERNRGGYER